MSSPCSEVFINLDTDGINRIQSAGEAANANKILTDIYGDEDWNVISMQNKTTAQACREYMILYRKKLQSRLGVRYHFPFEMRKSGSLADYFLVFASNSDVGSDQDERSNEKKLIRAMEDIALLMLHMACCFFSKMNAKT